VQIPLDFYRILGVPHRATLEQLQQAFDDRLQQLPRQEYSSAAIAARKQLLEDAFVMLADPQKRLDYDKKLSTQDEGTAKQELAGLVTETPDNKLAGVLLVLQETGAYPQILDIGSAYFQRPIDLSKLPVGAGALEDDVVLAMSLAHLELGREQWQQSRFEQAGESLQKGLDPLEQEQRFPSVQAEIQGDLFKLRPYRILEALDDEDPDHRKIGLTLLQAMLNDRDGIDGNQDDQSGLSVNDFLRFVQQLREYLTVEEQQTLFEQEAARPSAVASYLAVYALIARGVSERTPLLIQRAKALLTQLKDRQDVAIEVGMCWLLLGQPLAAHQSVQLSQDQDSLAFMQQYSGGAPDLIPGLYLYTENWLQQEVYPYFRDLLDRKVSLQGYFNDPNIQKILNEIEIESPAPVRAEPVKSQALKSQDPSFLSSKPKTDHDSLATNPEATTESATSGSEAKDFWSLALGLEALGDRAAVESSDQPMKSASPGRLPKTVPAVKQNAQARRKRVQQEAKKDPAGPKKKRLRKWVPWAIAFLLGTGVVAGALALGRLFNHSRPAIVNSPDLNSDSSVSVSTETAGAASPTSSASPTSVLSPPTSSETSPETSPKTSPRTSSVAQTPPATGVAVSPASPAASSSPTSLGTSAAVSPPPALGTGPLSQTDAKQLVQSWQIAKAQAMSESHDTGGLKQILAEPALAQWQYSVDQVRQNKGHWKYSLDQLELVSIVPQGANRSLVKANIKETAEYFERGKLVKDQSYTGSYLVQYIALRKGQQWLIQDMQVLK
jgi:curved DNA-binding protein CbpA